MNKQNFKKNKRQRGFVMLFAVLISTLVLAVGISMISIALKQVQLSGSGRDSQFAFYVANTGAECATYWDLASSSVFTSVNNRPSDTVKCLGKPIASTFTISSTGTSVAGSLDDVVGCLGGDINIDTGWCTSGGTGNSETSFVKFRIAYGDKPYCADVIVKKERNSLGIVGTTTVTSRGYNTCDTSNPRRIERSLEFIY